MLHEFTVFKSKHNDNAFPEQKFHVFRNHGGTLSMQAHVNIIVKKCFEDIPRIRYTDFKTISQLSVTISLSHNIWNHKHIFVTLSQLSY